MSVPPQSDYRPKILLIGAYGNGNLGDTIQAEYLGRKILKILPGAQIDAVSRSTLSTYGGTCSQKDPDLLKNKRSLNTYDAIMIGGGGILAARHRPMCDPGWATTLKVPVGLIAIGAESTTILEYTELLAQSSYISARDSRSIHAIKDTGYACRYLADPILGSFHEFAAYRQCLAVRPAIVSASLIRDFISQLFKKRKYKILWILRKKISASQPADDALAKLFKPQDSSGSFFPSADYASGIFDDIPLKTEDITSIEKFFELADKADFIVSDRLHACILAFLIGIDCVGLDNGNSPYPKVKKLFTQMDADDLYFEAPELAKKIHTLKISGLDRTAARNSTLAAISDSFDAELRHALSILLPASIHHQIKL
jgi:polysaccharide pyruvyl transferase WcaK-like protein